MSVYFKLHNEQQGVYNCLTNIGFKPACRTALVISWAGFY